MKTSINRSKIIFIICALSLQIGCQPKLQSLDDYEKLYHKAHKSYFNDYENAANPLIQFDSYLIKYEKNPNEYDFKITVNSLLIFTYVRLFNLEIHKGNYQVAANYLLKAYCNANSIIKIEAAGIFHYRDEIKHFVELWRTTYLKNNPAVWQKPEVEYNEILQDFYTIFFKKQTLVESVIRINS